MMSNNNQEQAIKNAIAGYVEAIPVPAMKNTRVQPEPGSRRSQLLRWSPLAVLVAVLVAFFFTDTAQAIYQQIIVYQRSQPVANLEVAIQRASFPVWVSDQAQIATVQEIGEGRGYSLIMYYKVNGKEAFLITQSSARGGIPRWDDAKIVQKDINIQGSPAVIYEATVVDEQGMVVNRVNNLYVMLDEVNVSVMSPFDKSLSPEQLIAIAQGLRRASP